MKIAMIGPGGSGKTTTAKALHRYYSVPLIVEGVREIISEWGMSLSEIRETRLFEFQKAILERKKREELGLDKFIADRSTVDVAAYTHMFTSNLRGTKADIHKFYSDCEQHAEIYDYLFYFPVNSLTLKDDGVRSADFEYQKRAGKEIMEILLDWELERKTYIIRESSLENRVREILKVIGKL